MSDNKIFELGKEVPRVWLHMEFDFDDTMKYMNGAVIESEDEVDRLYKKYCQNLQNKEQP